MGYSQPNDVRLVLSSDAEEIGGTAADLSDSQLQYEINSASAYIDSSLRIIYQVPFNPVPVLINSIATDMAAYGADLNYRKSREYDSQNMPIILRYNKALNTLNMIRTGDLTLGSPRIDYTTQGTQVIHQYEYPLFTGDDVFGHIPGW